MPEFLNSQMMDEWSDESLDYYHEQIRIQIARLAIIERQCQEQWDRRYPK